MFARDPPMSTPPSATGLEVSIDSLETGLRFLKLLAIGEEEESAPSCGDDAEALDEFVSAFFSLSSPPFFTWRSSSALAMAFRSACPTLSLALSVPMKFHLAVYGFNFRKPVPEGDLPFISSTILLIMTPREILESALV